MTLREIQLQISNLDAEYDYAYSDSLFDYGSQMGRMGYFHTVVIDNGQQWYFSIQGEHKYLVQALQKDQILPVMQFEENEVPSYVCGQISFKEDGIWSAFFNAPLSVDVLVEQVVLHDFFVTYSPLLHKMNIPVRIHDETKYLYQPTYDTLFKNDGYDVNGKILWSPVSF